jgi:uncharacterized membrane protein
MNLPVQRSQRLADYTNILFEIFVIACTILPFLALTYFYQQLPDRVPLFLNFKGEVETWGQKSLVSVFRVPLMATLTQVVCLLMKYGTLKSGAGPSLGASHEQVDDQNQYLNLQFGLWDWFRCLVAVKMSASSLETVFLSLSQFMFLAKPAFAITALAAILSLVGAVVYAYRLLIVHRKLKAVSNDSTHKPIDRQHVYGRFLYFNRSDSALFANKYIFNFGNKWAYVFIACIIAYPLLVFLPE